MLVCGIRIFTAVYTLDKVYSYLSTEDQRISVGDMVSVPFGGGNKNQKGIVVSLKEYDRYKAENNADDENPYELKSVSSILLKNAVSAKDLDLIDFICTRYFTTFYEASKLLLPPGSDKSINSLRNPVPSAKNVKYISIGADEAVDAFMLGLSQSRKEKYSKALAVLREDRDSEMQLSLFTKITSLSYQTVSKLASFGVVKIFEKREYRDPFSHIALCERDEAKDILTEEQETAYIKLKGLMLEDKANCALLYGVTGSGKTKVMLKLIDDAISCNKSVIMLVPEIALTGQAMRILISRYGDKVAVLHSALSDGERYDQWSLIKSGEKKIVLGTRSAVFAPCKDLGLIIIDEEHDHSYKSDSHARYHARDIAKFLCARTNSLLLLASATPDLDSYYKAKTGKYHLLTLKKRYNEKGMPDVEIADVRNDFRDSPNTLIGKKLKSALDNVLRSNEQAILFINRRGYNQFIMCRSCSEAITCPNCSVSLTYHIDGGRRSLHCHYCGYKRLVPNRCPSCGSDHLMNFGYGTQQLEEQIKQNFPDAKVLRFDADTVTKKNSHDSIINAFRNKEADILIGTQMVAKGHDFPGVSLVGVIMADSSLYSSDYKAKEQSFALFTQVMGRAGRASVPGHALIQTFSPYNETLMLSSTQDYEKFYESEIALRKALLFPPFCDICSIELKGDKEDKINEDSKLLLDMISEMLKNDFKDIKIILYGPFEAFPYKVNNVYRKKVIIKFKYSSRLALFIDTLIRAFPKDSKGTYLSVDINPMGI